MSARKTLDIDPELQAILAKAEKKQRDYQMMLGEIVLETGVHKELDADELRAVLIEARDKAIANRTPAKEAAATDGTFPARPATARAHGHADPEPARPRHPDLLARAEEA